MGLFSSSKEDRIRGLSKDLRRTRNTAKHYAGQGKHRLAAGSQKQADRISRELRSLTGRSGW